MHLRRALAPLAAGLLITLLLTWPIPLAALRYGLISHNYYNTARPWTSPSGDPCFLRSSHLLLSDWYQVSPVQPGDSPRPGESARVPSWVAIPAPSDRWLLLIDTGAEGWPFRAFASERWQFTTPRLNSNPVSFEELRWARTLATTPRGRIILPLRPIWPGLLADTFLYTALSWSLFATLRTARRALRRRRGHCPRCNYNLSGLSARSPCPECGPHRTA